MSETRPFFKPWVPNWLAILTIFLILFPSLVIFALYYNSTLAVAEYYSMDAMDVQYSVVLMYATVISWLALDSRLIKCFKISSYTIAGIFINTVTCLICAETHSKEVFMFCRFIQGAVCAFLCNICMNLSFTRFKPHRAKVLGYTVFYGSLMTCVPFSAIFANLILNWFGVESVFYGFILFQIPGFILLLITMNNRYLTRRFPISADWSGFILYTAIVSIIGYILVYGQQLEWYSSPRIRLLTLILLIITPVYVLSSLNKKRPLIYLRLLKRRRYREALFLLTMFYISKGTTFFSYVFMQDVLGIDSVSMIRIWGMNIIGLLIGIFMVAYLLLKGVTPRNIIRLGFFVLLIFHTMMFFLFASTGSEEKYYLPLLIQGIGTGSLFVPLIMNMVLSVAPKDAGLVASLGIAARYLGFCLAIALINYFAVWSTNTNYTDMATSFTVSNEMTLSTQIEAVETYKGIGFTEAEAQQLVNTQMSKALQKESAIRTYMNYYSFIVIILFALLVYLSLETLPTLKRMRKSFTKIKGHGGGDDYPKCHVATLTSQYECKSQSSEHSHAQASPAQS